MGRNGKSECSSLQSRRRSVSLFLGSSMLPATSPRTSDLVAISIEGPSMLESALGEGIESGEQVIDLAEYYGSEELAVSEFVNYIQLKHSTKNADTPWEPSRLERTLKGFAERFLALEAVLGSEQLPSESDLACFKSTAASGFPGVNH